MSAGVLVRAIPSLLCFCRLLCNPSNWFSYKIAKNEKIIIAVFTAIHPTTYRSGELLAHGLLKTLSLNLGFFNPAEGYQTTALSIT